MDDELTLPAEVFEPEGHSEDQWRQLLDWADATAEAGRSVRIEDVPESARWQCTTEADAEWAMARLAEHQREIAEVNQRYDAYFQQLETQRSRRLSRAAAGSAYLNAQLTFWAERRRQDDEANKTTHLAAGAIRTRTVPAKPVIEDQAQLVAWFKAQGWGDEVKVAESVPMATLRKRCEMTDVVTHTAVQLQCGDQKLIEGKAVVGEVAECRLHPGDLVMIEEVLAEIPCLVMVKPVESQPGASDEPLTVPGVRVEPERISVTVDPHVVMPAPLR